MKIIISRTDNLGDVVLTLPLAGFLKQANPQIEVFFVGKAYTRPLIECSTAVDKFIDREDLLQNPQKFAELQADAIVFAFPDKELARAAKQARIPQRIGTSHRWWHWLYANKRVSFSRKRSNLHEAQLNFKLLKPLGYAEIPALPTLADWYGLVAPALPAHLLENLPTDRPKVILHPKSKGSAREWGLEKFYALAKQRTDIHFLLTGVAQEGEAIRAELPAIFDLPNVSDWVGKTNLRDMIALIGACDALVAASTGTLHIAAALGKKAIGIYPPMKPIHPARWQPVGKQAHVLALDKDCNACRKVMPCYCMEAIAVGEVAGLL